MGKTALLRPEAPHIERPLAWPGGAVAVFGAGALSFAETLAEAIAIYGGERPPLVRMMLRHATGFAFVGGVLASHPDALLDAIASLPRDRLTIGVGEAFASAVQARWTVHIRARNSVRAARADLILNDPRPGVAEELGREIARRR